MTNPFKEADITALAESANTREHALARLKDQQCMEGLRERIRELEEQAEPDMTCRVCGCTLFNPCDPPCAWAEPYLCTACAEKGRSKMSEKQESCNHIWEPMQSDSDGNPDFRMNRQMSPEPLLAVICGECGARTWFTEEQWDQLDER